MKTNETLPIVENPAIDSIKQTIWNWKKWNVFKFLSFGITVTMLVLAIYSQCQAKEIIKSMPTQYIGAFPETIDDINKYIKDAKKSIVIFEDVAAYGIFSDPERFHETVTLLREKSKHIPITLYVYDLDFYRKELLPMFFLGLPSISEYDSLSNEKKNTMLKKNIKDKYNYFVNYNYSNRQTNKNLEDLYELNTCRDKFLLEKKLDSVESEIFFDCLIEMIDKTETILERENEQNNKKGIKIIHIGKEYRMFYWLFDEKRAIFTFLNTTGYEEVAFQTTNSDLIRFMKDAEKHYRDYANKLVYKPYHHQ